VQAYQRYYSIFKGQGQGDHDAPLTPRLSYLGA
jgi:hypothetical protein